MAIVTRKLGGDANGLVEFQIDYDDVALYLVTLRCINQTAQSAWGQATLTSDRRRTAQMQFPGNQTTEITLPTKAQDRLGISITPNGRVDGVEYSFMYPYPAR